MGCASAAISGKEAVAILGKEQEGCASARTLVTRSMDGGMALPPTPILVQSIVSPSSSKVIRPYVRFGCKVR